MIDRLPDDLLYLICPHLETARDLRALLLTNRRLRDVIQNGDKDEGWRLFVRSRFPDVSGVSLSSSSRYSWRDLANSLTWQARAWERRSLSFRAMMPTPPPPPANRSGRPPRRREAAYHPALDAHFDFATGEDLVIWGAGEDLVARRRRGRSAEAIPEKTVWHRLDGKDLGYRSGVDDIKALSLVEGACGRAGKVGAVVGRDNGNLVLLSTGECDFGERLAAFSPRPEQASAQATINSVDVSRRNGLVAAATKSGAFLYPLPQEPGADVAPAAHLDLASVGQVVNPAATTLGNAKWMGESTLALVLPGCKDPLRYVSVAQAGFGNVVPVRNTPLEDKFEINYHGTHICTSSLTRLDASSVAGGGASSLLLSAWRDGTVRLQDLRTPSALDTVYCDNIDPHSDFESLLPFGTSHFAAAGAHGASVKIFDLRWPRRYHHTQALPCGDMMPLPTPPQPFMAPPRRPRHCPPRCDHHGASCRWHRLSRELYYRPNGKFFFSKALPREHAHAGVWSMARASPVSPGFYVGISGGVVEADLAAAPGPESPAAEMRVDPTFGYSVAAGGPGAMGPAGYTAYELGAALMETGDGLLDLRHSRGVRMPPMRGRGWSRITEKIGVAAPEALVRRHRLDARYHVVGDFDRADLWGAWDAAPDQGALAPGERSWFDDRESFEDVALGDREVVLAY